MGKRQEGDLPLEPCSASPTAFVIITGVLSTLFKKPLGLWLRPQIAASCRGRVNSAGVYGSRTSRCLLGAWAARSGQKRKEPILKTTNHLEQRWAQVSRGPGRQGPSAGWRLGVGALQVGEGRAGLGKTRLRWISVETMNRRGAGVR